MFGTCVEYVTPPTVSHTLERVILFRWSGNCAFCSNEKAQYKAILKIVIR